MRGRRYDFSIKRWQRRVAHFYFRGPERIFLCAAQGLLAALVEEFGEGRWRDGSASALEFDGIALEFQKRQPDHFTGYGIQYLLGSSEPLMLSFAFDASARRMTGATILFGMQPRPAPVPTHILQGKMLALALDARHRLSFDWEYDFTLAGGEWS
jgi:hypothetical protein